MHENAFPSFLSRHLRARDMASNRPRAWVPQRCTGARPWALAATLGVFCVASLPTSAATLTWDADAVPGNGATDGAGTWNTNTTANWYNGTNDVMWTSTSTAADTAVFGAGTAGTYAVTVAGTVYVGGVTFNTSGYSINTSTGNVLNLVPTTGNFTITTNTGISGTDTLGALTGATLNVPAGTAITKTGSGTLVLGNLTGGTGASPVTLKVTGGTFNTTVGYFDSVVRFGTGFANTLGSAPTNPATQLTLDAGTLNFTSGGQTAIGGYRTIQVTANGGAIIDVGGDQFQSSIVNSATASTSLYLSNTSATAPVRFNTNAISGTGSVTINGVGAISLEAANTYQGGTMINSGTLLANNAVASPLSTTSSATGTGTVTVGNATGTLTAVLGGTGSVVGATTINPGSKITGGTVGTVGALTLQGGLTLTGTAITPANYTVDISGATSDTLAITGALSLTNASITFSGTPTAGDTYVLATYGSEAGTFSGTVPSGFALSYGATALDLIPVPEPATWVGGLLSVGTLVFSQRRRLRTLFA